MTGRLDTSIPVTLQAAGLRIARWQAVALDGIICTVISLFVVFFGDFNTYPSNFLLFMIVWFAPWTAIFIVDYVLRRGRCDSASLETDGTGRYRRPGGMHLPGVVAQAVGMIASLLWINTSVFVGPLAKAGNGIDLSVPAGLLVAGAVYWAQARRSVAAEADPVDPVTAPAMPAPEFTAGAPHAPLLDGEPVEESCGGGTDTRRQAGVHAVSWDQQEPGVLQGLVETPHQARPGVDGPRAPVADVDQGNVGGLVGHVCTPRVCRVGFG